MCLRECDIGRLRSKCVKSCRIIAQFSCAKESSCGAISSPKSFEMASAHIHPATNTLSPWYTCWHRPRSGLGPQLSPASALSLLDNKLVLDVRCIVLQVDRWDVLSRGLDLGPSVDL